MENKLDEITFTNYNEAKFILHTNEGKHYIVSKEKKAEIEKILESEDTELKNSVIEKIKTLKSTQKNNLMFFSDFQFKRAIISDKMMRKISSAFIIMFNKYVMFFISIIIITIPSYFYFINTPAAITGNIPLGFSWALVLLVFFFHEIGHATACTKFNVKAGEIGFGITSYFPVLYANVTEAWRLERKERMIVNFGGVYFQNIFSLLLMSIGLLTKHFELFFISKTIYIATIYQFFPFYKSDGYWILSDLISEPNLFKTSRNIFYKKLRNPHHKLNRKSYLIMVYYSIISGIITFFIVKMGLKYFDYIINLPFFIFNCFEKIIDGQYKNLNLDASYLWAVFYVIFTSKMIVNNVKTFILSNGADKVK